MNRQKTPERLSKFLDYILGRRPDEFGLVPDPDGYVKIKDLIKVLGEEAGWKYVRKQHLDEITVTLPKPSIEVDGTLVRSVNRALLPLPSPAQNPPKLLFACVRRKAHAFVLEKGLVPADRDQVVLSSSPELAQRMGRRMDTQAVLVTVQVAPLLNHGVTLSQAGETLFLAGRVPPECLTAPPLPKQKPEPPKKEVPKERTPPHMAGSFQYDPLMEAEKKRAKQDRKKKEIAWKKDRKRMKKLKRGSWP